MKYLMLIKHSEAYRAQQIPQPLIDAMTVFVTKAMQDGTIKETSGLKPSSEAFRVRSSGGRLKVTDGPFTEAKELVGGYAMVEVPTRDAALELAREFMEIHRVQWPEFDGECEVRPLEEM